ncbi:hypothetical protein C8J56DRAFT_806986 [Mycena floridula]|nr:hypothetical protein C8J56DRAFT_806986 [Mycena floridula]
MQKASSIAKFHLLFSLLMFLKVSLAAFFQFVFESEIKVITDRVSRFMGYTPSAQTADAQFPPSMLFRHWYNQARFPRARKHLQAMIQECAFDIAVEESDNIISYKGFKLRIKSLTIASLRKILNPKVLVKHYQELAPFTWNLLLKFSSSPNPYRRRNQTTAANDATDTGPAEFSDWDDDPDLDEMGPDGPQMFTKDEGFTRNPIFAVMAAISMLAFVRNKATNILPLMLGLFFKINGTGSRPMQLLSNIGLSVSSRTVERLKKRISEDAIALAVELMRSGKLFYVIFDNINIFLRKFQQRITNKNSMIHATNCCIIAIDEDGIDVQQAQNLQDKLDLRGKCVNAVFADLTPTSDDDNHMAQAFPILIADFITRYCPGSDQWPKRKEMLEKIQSKMPQDCPLPPKKTDTRPFGVFDINEGSKKGLVAVLTAICERAKFTVEEWSSKVRIIVGDWLTSNNLRGARRDRVDDVDLFEQIAYADELSALFHYALQATHKIMHVHFGNAVLDPTSLAAHKGILGRTWDAAKPNYAAAKSLIRHSLIARLLFGVMSVLFSFNQWSQLRTWRPTLDEILELSVTLRDTLSTVAAAEAAKEAKDDWQAHNIYFIRDALLFCRFEHAVSYSDAGPILRVMKYWLLAFRGAGQHNYARECAEVLIKWKYEMTEPMRMAMERSWFVNRWALSGRSIASDLYLEQLNFWVKVIFIAQGSGVTMKYIIEKGSACVEAFRDITHLVSNFFGDPDRSRRSKEIAFMEDMRIMVEDMLQKKLDITTERFVPAMVKQNKRKPTTKTPPPKSAIFDIQVTSSGMWAKNKFWDFIMTTTFDPALGYPIAQAEQDEQIHSGTVFDSFENPLICDSHDDFHGDADDSENGICALGGSGEYFTG